MGAWIEIEWIEEKELEEESLLSWERGLKLMTAERIRNWVNVAPLVGAWIEIIIFLFGACRLVVAPLVGAWIEIDDHLTGTATVSVAPLVGAWIEIGKNS